MGKNEAEEAAAAKAADASVKATGTANRAAAAADVARADILAEAEADRKAMTKATNEYVGGENAVKAKADAESDSLEDKTAE